MEYERIYHDLYMGDQQDLLALTGCLLPCTYTQYSLVGSPKRFSDGRVRQNCDHRDHWSRKVSMFDRKFYLSYMRFCYFLTETDCL